MSAANPDDDIAAALQRFLDHLRNERRLSPHTVSGYARDLAALGEFMRERGTADWQALTPWDLRAFAAAAHRRGLHPRSIARRLSAARSLFRYLRREGVLGHDPAADVRPPKAPRRLPATLDADAMASLLARLEDGPLGLRDRAILELIYSSGLRLAELTGLSLTDIDLADATVQVTGKGNRGRILPVGRQAREALAAWLKARGQLAA
jgi:integrase/recombinase XerC